LSVGSDAGEPAGAAIGVFDSGIGGLSVLTALRTELPHENFVYFADAGHAPYGERDEAHAARRSIAVARELLAAHRIKALVVACNTATAAAIHLLRQTYPSLPLVGVEPALKPAVAASRTHRIAVLATRGTVTSRKFEALRESLAGKAEFVVVACDGLATAVEQGDATAIAALCARYVAEAGRFGRAGGLRHGAGGTYAPAAASRSRARPRPRGLRTVARLSRALHRHIADAGAALAVGARVDGIRRRRARRPAGRQRQHRARPHRQPRDRTRRPERRHHPHRVDQDRHRAFGVRIVYQSSVRESPFQSERLSLYVPEGPKLRKVLDELELERQSGDWDTNCSGTFRTVRSTLAVASTSTNGYADLALRQTGSNSRSALVGDECVTRERPATFRTTALHYDGARYRIPKELKSD
jgi:hypothetical protein